MIIDSWQFAMREKGCIMKESRYNIGLEYNGQYILFNSRTIATAALDDTALEVLHSVREGKPIEESNLVSDMKRVGFLVDDNMDELHMLEMNYNLSKNQKSGLGLVIAPTMACNFACPYCFEGIQTGIMSENIQNKIISMASHFAKEGQNITVTWFGGEPLLAKKVIYSMSEEMMPISKQEQVGYTARLITNGYLLDEECVLKLKECNVDFVQITLDGLPETHNRKRKLKYNSSIPTFDRILENVLIARNHGIRTSVRINVDKETQHQLDAILEMMIEKGLGESLYLGHVDANTESSKNFCSNCLTREEFAHTALEFEKKLFENNIPTDYPVPIRTKCGADYLFSYVIDSDGDLYKCWNDIGVKQNSIGNIGEIENFIQLVQLPNKNYSKYLTWSPFKFEKCTACEILPICQGGCPYNGIDCGEPVCDNWKYELEQYIKLKCDAATRHTD